MLPEAKRSDLRERIDRIEESYEFMLAYAARGIGAEEAATSGAQLRDYLRRTDEALAGLAGLFTALVEEEAIEPAERYHAFIAVLDRDAESARAALQLVLAQRAITSQLIDNLNASIHLRALLTDLFLIDEILKIAAPEPARA